ncbi:centromere protein F-like isoform X4 [Gouania willdenowi]|uniref:centromere protein F-like isoform X4 n=1 Tax=Gouania willdenowi TaxID=441366 RepID=UPI00105648E5|nr:centromere protein F-like isoform X4 [Gouania willdenowi]
MSWAEEDWTVGLSGRVLQKVKELQVQQERLSRENKQKQLQLDNIHISLRKQTTKYEEVRVELQSRQRELQSVQEEAKTAFNSKERLSQEVQTKQAQICSLEGQLDAARAHNNKLTREIKRLKAELEKLQNSRVVAGNNDLAEVQKERQFPKKQHQQGVNKLYRELQQARTLHNALQAQLDQVTRQTQQLTTAFEKQSKHIAGLLAELQEKERRHDEELLQ